MWVLRVMLALAAKSAYLKFLPEAAVLTTLSSIAVAFRADTRSDLN